MASTNAFLTLYSTVQTNLVGSTITTGFIPYISTAGRQAYTSTLSTLTVSTLTAVSSITSNVNCSTLVGSTLTTSNVNCSTIVASTLTSGTAFSTNTTDTFVYGNLYANSGFGSAGLAYGCRAWGSATSFSANGLISTFVGANCTLSRTAVGKYTVTLATAMPDINYSVVASGNGCYAQNLGVIAEYWNTARTTTSFVLNGQYSTGSGQGDGDILRFSFAVYR